MNIFRRQKTKNSSDTNNKKLSLHELIWFGFNYTAGIAFTAIFASRIYSDNVAFAGTNVGVHIIWIFIIEGIIAGICAWAYNRLSRVHPQGNGAGYVYTRTSYGRFMAWFIAFIQYTTLPVVVDSQIVGMIRINFTDPNSILYANWGHWTQFYLDLIGIFIYGLASCSLFLGMRWFKKLVNISGFIKWGSTVILLVFAVALFAISGPSNFSSIANNSTINANSFSSAFTSCFFFFLGFETYSTISKNVNEPEKNIGRSVVWVMLITTIFYVFVIVMFIGALSSFTDNPNLQVFEVFGKSINAQWFGVLGTIIMLICTISLKLNAGMQNALYSGGILEPLAVEGFIPSKFKEVNKDNIPFKASFLNLIITFIFAIVWLLLPDIIYSINFNSSPGDQINYGTIVGEASLIEIIIYAIVISIALKLAFEKKLNANWIERLAWIFAFVFLIWQFVEFFIAIGDDYKNGKTISASIELGYIALIFIFAVVWYFAYYYPKYLNRLHNNPEFQKELDNEFRIIDDWSYVVNEMNRKLSNYLERNKKIYGNENNQNNEIALKLHNDIKHHIKKVNNKHHHNDDTDEKNKN